MFCVLICCACFGNSQSSNLSQMPKNFRPASASWLLHTFGCTRQPLGISKKRCSFIPTAPLSRRDFFCTWLPWMSGFPPLRLQIFSQSLLLSHLHYCSTEACSMTPSWLQRLLWLFSHERQDSPPRNLCKPKQHLSSAGPTLPCCFLACANLETEISP